MLLLNGRPAFELSYWCGTCQFLFGRQDGANQTVSVDSLRSRLAEPIHDIPMDVTTAFVGLLERGYYLPLLLRVQPRLVAPAADADYFHVEQVATWGVESFWGLPVYPRTAYYRTYETAVDDDAHLYEFVVPMVPPTWNDRDQVQFYIDRLERGLIPTAVSVSTLDICAPATETAGTDWYRHWCVTHFLLDGHHKLQAAAATGETVQLLSLVSLGGSLAQPQEVTRILSLLAQPRSSRQPRP